MFSTLLVPLDRSPLAEEAIGRAASLARRCSAKVDLVLVHEPIPHVPANDALWTEADLDRDEQYLDQVANDLIRRAKITVTCAVIRGEPADGIRLRAQQVHADLIVMTTHGRTGLSRAWLGSIADAVMRHASVPVVMLRPTATPTDRALPPPFTHLLVPLDGSVNAEAILPTATDFARANDAAVTLLRVVPPVPIIVPLDASFQLGFGPMIPDPQATAALVEEKLEQLTEVARRLQDRTGLQVDAHVCVGDHTADAIHDFAAQQGCDVIAMSTQGRGASRVLLGSVADKVLRSTTLPIVLRRSTTIGSPHDSAHDDHAATTAAALTPH